jgi:hypothetical protein
VILTDAEKVEKVYRALADGFYNGNPTLEEPVEQVLFTVEPSGGASVGDL